MTIEPAFFPGIDFPVSLQQLAERYSTKISVSRISQKVSIYQGDIAETWAISVLVITRICRACGLVPLFSNVSVTRQCLRHSWDKSNAILLFHSVDENLQCIQCSRRQGRRIFDLTRKMEQKISAVED